MKISDLENKLEVTKKKLEEASSSFSFDRLEEFKSMRREVLSLERKLAAERNDEFAETIDFPVKWDVGAPMPHLLANGHLVFLLFYLQDESPEVYSSVESVALVQFHRCVSSKLGDPNEEVFHGHSLYGKGLEPYAAQVVKNSRWIKELESVNKVHSQYDREFWSKLNHYVLWFHDETFECVAKSYEVEVFQKSMDEVVGDVVKRLLA